MWEAVVERFEQQAPVTVMARLGLEQALPADWIDQVFEEHRDRQYSRELLFSTVVELMTLVVLGLRPSLHAAARKMGNLPVSIAALYDKVKRTEPAVLRGLVAGSAQRLLPIASEFAAPPSLTGWRVRIVDGNHLRASEKRLKPLRDNRGAALPGHSLVVYDPDLGLVCDVVACEDEYESERVGVQPLVEGAQPGELWIADRHFCTGAILQGFARAGASFIVREHARHPRVAAHGEWSGPDRIETGSVREQTLAMTAIDTQETGKEWRRIEIILDQPSEAGDSMIHLWTNLPRDVDARTVEALYRKRWTIEGMFQRLESVLNSEIGSLGHPRAALLGFTVAILAYNVLSLIKRAIECAHRDTHPQLEVSTFHLATHVRSDYKGMLIAVPWEYWNKAAHHSTQTLIDKLLQLARQVLPRQVATSKRGPKLDKRKGYVDGATARSHVSTARVLKQARGEAP